MTCYRSLFSHIYAYTQSDFQPSLTFPFCQRLMINYFIYGRDSVHTSLQDSQSLGSHTGLMEFTPSLFSKTPNTSPNFYAWSHASKSPMGIRVSPQCTCKRMETIVITATNRPPYQITHRWCCQRLPSYECLWNFRRAQNGLEDMCLARMHAEIGSLCHGSCAWPASSIRTPNDYPEIFMSTM